MKYVVLTFSFAPDEKRINEYADRGYIVLHTALNYLIMGRQT